MDRQHPPSIFSTSPPPYSCFLAKVRQPLAVAAAAAVVAVTPTITSIRLLQVITPPHPLPLIPFFVRSCSLSVDRGDGGRRACRCLNLSTSMGGTYSEVEGGDLHDLEPEGTREDTRHKIYTGSGSRSSYPTSCLG
jgi:hypothetical protein